MHGNILLPFLLCDFKGMSPPSITSKGSQELKKGTEGERAKTQELSKSPH